MLKVKNIIFTNEIINLTDKPFRMYEESTGMIPRLMPSSEKLPDKPLPSAKCPSKYYVCEEDVIANLKASGRSLADIAYIRSSGWGRHNIEVSYIVSAEDEKTTIRLSRYKK